MMLFQQQQQQADENMSNLTSASGDQASVSSGTRNEIGYNFAPHQPQTQSQPPPKKKRNLPGHPGNKKKNFLTKTHKSFSLFFESCTVLV